MSLSGTPSSRNSAIRCATNRDCSFSSRALTTTGGCPRGCVNRAHVLLRALDGAFDRVSQQRAGWGSASRFYVGWVEARRLACAVVACQGSSRARVPARSPRCRFHCATGGFAITPVVRVRRCRAHATRRRRRAVAAWMWAARHTPVECGHRARASTAGARDDVRSAGSDQGGVKWKAGQHAVCAARGHGRGHVRESRAGPPHGPQRSVSTGSHQALDPHAAGSSLTTEAANSWGVGGFFE